MSIHLILLAFAMMSQVQPSKAVKLHLVSSEYVFVRGQITVLGNLDVKEELLLPDGERVGLQKLHAGVDVKPVPFENGLTEKIAVREAGVFVASLIDITAIRTSDRKEIQIPYVPLGEYRISQSDLEAGVATIKIRPLGRLHVQVVSAENRPVPNASVGLLSGYASGCLEFETNENGEFTFWGLQEGTYEVSLGPRSHHVRVKVSADEDAAVILRNR